MDFAVKVEHGDFTWDAPPPEPESKKKGKKDKSGTKTPGRTTQPEKVFTLQDISMEIPQGQLTAIVGPVGTGKTSLLEALIGEMRRTHGEVRFKGSVAYCPQSAWIQNATIRDNITFGRPFDEKKYWKAVHDACLETDIDMMPNGDLTEVGERVRASTIFSHICPYTPRSQGISLSGGQKQRINICRAIYVDADIQIFDDPLSALDAHVGKSVFTNVFLNATAGKTRILVTHALHFLPQVDYIYTVVDGRVAERGTYAELLARENGAFARFAKEFGAKEEQEEKEEAVEEAEPDEKAKKKKAVGNSPLMQAEERNTGAVSNTVYKAYLKAGKGGILIPSLILSLVFLQGAQVMSSYWLVYWQEEYAVLFLVSCTVLIASFDSKWPKPAGFYVSICGVTLCKSDLNCSRWASTPASVSLKRSASSSWASCSPS